MKIVYIFFAALMIIIGIIVSVVFFIQLSKEYSYTSEGPVLLSESGLTGDFIGGIVGTLFSLGGFFILIITLSSQNEANYLERFETSFFQLIDIHRQNVTDLNRSIIINHQTEKKIEYHGRKVIQLIVEDVLSCRNEVKSLFSKKGIYDVYETGYARDLNATFKYSNPDVQLLKLAKLNIPYCIVFFGINADGRRNLEKIFEGKYKYSFYKPLLDFISLKPANGNPYVAKWEKIKNITDYKKRIKIALGVLKRRGTDYNREEFEIDEQNLIEGVWYKNDFIKFYGGNQYRLGHYYRHLYQTITFVDNEKRLSRRKKYFYIKTLRAQLSTYEQVLLFMNSLSFLGMVWELTPKYRRTTFDTINMKRAKEKMLITKYQLIKNIPSADLFGFNIKDFYPHIKLESEESHLKQLIKT